MAVPQLTEVSCTAAQLRWHADEFGKRAVHLAEKEPRIDANRDRLGEEEIRDISEENLSARRRLARTFERNAGMEICRAVGAGAYQLGGSCQSDVAGAFDHEDRDDAYGRVFELTVSNWSMLDRRGFGGLIAYPSSEYDNVVHSPAAREARCLIETAKAIAPLFEEEAERVPHATSSCSQTQGAKPHELNHAVDSDVSAPKPIAPALPKSVEVASATKSSVRISNEQRHLLITDLLCNHHRPDESALGDGTPMTVRAIAAEAQVALGAVSEWFKERFGSHRAYQTKCRRNPAGLVADLRRFSGEGVGEHLTTASADLLAAEDEDGDGELDGLEWRNDGDGKPRYASYGDE